VTRAVRTLRSLDAAQVRAGVLGWLAGLLPVVAVNVIGYLGYLNTEDALNAGAIALFGGLALGGLLTGVLSGRARARRNRRVARNARERWWTAAATAGGLYVVTLLSLMVAAALLHVGTDIVELYPVPVAVAVVCLGSALAVIALGVGALAGRGARRSRSSVGQRSRQSGAVPAAGLVRTAQAGETRPAQHGSGPARVSDRQSSHSGGRPIPQRNPRR
jgi:hypothetical protein